MYRKFIEKSISFEQVKITSKTIDIFLFLAALALVTGYIIINLVIKPGAGTGQTDMLLSQRCFDFFGKDMAETLIREFQERNPELRIRLINISTEKNREPDLLFFDDSEFPDLLRKNALVSLKSYIYTESGAEQFAIPLASFTDLLFYNIELLEAAGFDRPPKTRDEFLACAKAVAGGGNAAGTALGLSPNDRQALSRDVFSWIWAAGGSFWLQPETAQTRPDRPVFNNKTGVDVISFLDELYREGILAPQSFTKTGADRLEEFAQGKIAMMSASSRDIPRLREKMGDSAFGITTIPGYSLPGKNSIALSNIYAGISAGCKDTDNAWSFLVFLAEQNQVLSAGLKAIPGAIIPGLPSGFSSPGYFNDDPYYSKVREIFESSKTIQGFSGKAQAEEFENIVWEELQVHFEEDRKAEETAVAIQKRWDSLYFRN